MAGWPFRLQLCISSDLLLFGNVGNFLGISLFSVTSHWSRLTWSLFRFVPEICWRLFQFNSTVYNLYNSTKQTWADLLPILPHTLWSVDGWKAAYDHQLGCTTSIFACLFWPASVPCEAIHYPGQGGYNWDFSVDGNMGGVGDRQPRYGIRLINTQPMNGRGTPKHQLNTIANASLTKDAIGFPDLLSAEGGNNKQVLFVPPIWSRTNGFFMNSLCETLHALQTPRILYNCHLKLVTGVNISSLGLPILKVDF